MTWGTDTNRTVHARSCDGHELVRYERAGKWYVEYADGRPRAAQTLTGACLVAHLWESLQLGVVLRGQPGGKMFDARLARMVAGASLAA